MNLRHAPWAESADFAIGLKPIARSAWLEGGGADPAGKDELLARHRHIVWAETEGSRPAQAEVLALVNEALGENPPPDDLPPLYDAARRVADDLCLMEKTDGQWRLSALSLSSPSFFSAHQVIGRSLAELHGPVTGFSDRFLARVVRIFDGLRPGLVLERRNWTVINSPEPFLPDVGPVRARIPRIDPETAGQALHLRVERQTLRRLPQTGAALFTIRIWLDPLDALLDDPDRLAAFALAWRTAPPAFRAYKQLGLYDDLVEGFLRAAGETYSVNAPASPS